MHITVNDNNPTTSVIDIKPYGNFINLSIKFMLENILLMSGKNQGITKNAIVIIAAII